MGVDVDVMLAVALGVELGVALGVCVGVALGVRVGVALGVWVGVAVGVWDGVLVGVAVGVFVGVVVGVAVGVSVGVSVGVAVGVEVGVAVGVSVGVAVGVSVGVAVGVLVGVVVGVLVGVVVGVAVGVFVGVTVGVLVGVAVGVLVGVEVGVFVGVAGGVFVGVAVGVVVGVVVGVLVGVCVGVAVGVAVGGRWHSAEEDRVPVVVADESVEVPVAVDVRQRRRGIVPHVHQAEGVGRRGREGRRRRAARVAEEDRVADIVADEGVEVAVAVDVRERRLRQQRHDGQAEGVRRGRRERRRRGAAGVAEEERVAVGLADESVEVAVAVDVRQNGRTQHMPTSARPKGWSRRPRRPARSRCRCCGRRACCRQALPDERVEVAVAVDVREPFGWAMSPTSVRPKGLVEAPRRPPPSRCRCCGRRSCRRPGSDEGVEIAVAVDVRQGRGAQSSPTSARPKGLVEVAVERSWADRGRRCEEDNVAEAVADEGVEVAVAVDVANAGVA